MGDVRGIAAMISIQNRDTRTRAAAAASISVRVIVSIANVIRSGSNTLYLSG